MTNRGPSFVTFPQQQPDTLGSEGALKSALRELAVIRRILSVMSVSILMTGLQAHAQFNGNIQGVILDPNGAAVAGATVSLSNVDTGITATTLSSDTGNYRFNSLEPGNYVIKASANGFESTEVKVTLQTSQTWASMQA